MTVTTDQTPRAAAQTEAAEGQSAPRSSADPSQLASKETFLQLLVAQIKNQNPLNPADGVQFLSQLAQFSELEQLIEIRQGIQALREGIPAGNAPASGPADGGVQAAAKQE